MIATIAEGTAQAKPKATQEQEQEQEKETAKAKEAEQEQEHEQKQEVKAKPAKPKARQEAGRAGIVPYARRLAEEYGIDWTQIEGTGPDGRITAEDVAATGAAKRKPEKREKKAEAAAARAEEELPALEVTSDEASVADAPFRLKTQARRVIASQHIIPHFYVTRGVDVTRLIEMKEELKERYGASLTHVVMFACLRSLAEHPEVNRSYDRGKVVSWKVANLGLAVDTEQGLTVAVLHDAGALGFGELVERTRELVEHARADKLSAEERRHPTLTITNLGMLDVEHFEPIINPPSSVTLAVASALPAAVVREGAVFIGNVMKLTAACDHRIIDGATAARFLKDLRALLEAPDGLLEGT